MDLDEIEAKSEVSLDTLPTECLIKIINFLTMEEKLTLAAVAPRFLEIISDPYFAKNWKLLIEGYIYPDIKPCKTFLNNLNQRSFLNVEVGNVEYADEEVYLQMFSNIGRHTKHLKLASHGHIKLLSCFPQLETLDVEGIHDLHCYDPIPSGIKKIHLKTIDQYIGEELKGVKNLEEVTSEVIVDEDGDCFYDSEEFDTNLFVVSKELSTLLKDEYMSFSTQKSLFKAHIDFSDITTLRCSSSFDPFNGKFTETLNLFENLKHLDYETYANFYLCYDLHEAILNLPRLKSLNLSVWKEYYHDSFCDKCFKTIMNSSSNLISLTKVSLSVGENSNQVTEFVQRFPLITDLTLNMNKASDIVLASLSHIKKLKKLELSTMDDITVSMLKNFPSFGHLEELNLKDVHLAYDEHEYSTDEYSESDESDAESVKRDISYYGRFYVGSLFSDLTLKCPNVKKFMCVVLGSDYTDVLAVINGWPKLNFLEINLGSRSTPIEFEEVFRCLQKQKEQGWKAPPLKHFAYLSRQTEALNLTKLFDIFPTLRTVQFFEKYKRNLSVDDNRKTITLADYQKKLLENL